MKQKNPPRLGPGLVRRHGFIEGVLASRKHLLLMYGMTGKLVQQLLKMKTQSQIWHLQREKETKRFNACQMVSSVQRAVFLSIPDEIIKYCCSHMVVINIRLFPRGS